MVETEPEKKEELDDDVKDAWDASSDEDESEEVVSSKGIFVIKFNS